jgi:hypothetical protein
MEKYYNEQIKLLMNLKKQKEAELEAIKKKLRELVLKSK